MLCAAALRPLTVSKEPSHTGTSVIPGSLPVASMLKSPAMYQSRARANSRNVEIVVIGFKQVTNNVIFAFFFMTLSGSETELPLWPVLGLHKELYIHVGFHISSYKHEPLDYFNNCTCMKIMARTVVTRTRKAGKSGTH